MAIIPGAISLVFLTAGSVSLTATPSTDGFTSLTYQWYSVLTSAFTPQTWVPNAGDAVAGATTLNLTDAGLAPATGYTYLLATSDATNPTVLSAPFSVTTLRSPSAIADPEVIQFCNEKVRPFADLIRSLMYTAISLQAHVAARPALLDKLPNDANATIQDNLNHPMSAHDCTNMIAWAGQIIQLGSGVADMQNSIEKCALNGRAIF